MKNADDTVLCKWILEMLADKRGQKIIFSPKPFSHEAGNGLHHHILLREKDTGINIF
jgi:glutamine synthetase